MTYAPKSIRDLAAYFESVGGKPLGIVGNGAHCGGYHLGRDRIYGACACKPHGICAPGARDRDYSVQHARDKAGLSDAASAIDLGRVNGSLRQMRSFSRWLVRRCQDGAPGTRDIREIIYTPDGERVQRYSGIDGEVHTGPGNGDSSHLTHTHISFFRDSEGRSKVGLFAPYFATVPVPDTATGGINVNLSDFTVFTEPREAVVPKGTRLYTGLDLDEATATIVSPGRVMPVAGKFVSGPLLVGLTPDDGSDADRVTWRLVRPRDVDVRRVATDADCTDAAAEARAAQAAEDEAAVKAALAERDAALADREAAIAAAVAPLRERISRAAASARDLMDLAGGS